MKKSASRILSLVLVMVMFLSIGITPAAAAEARGGFDDEEDVEITEPVAEEPAPEEGEDPAPAEEPAEPETPVEEPAEPETPVEEPAEPETPVEEPTEPETPVEEPAEPEIPEKPEEPVAAEAAFPAATLGVITESGLKVMVEAPEGAFPEGTEMSVREVAGSEIQSLIDASEFAGMESLVSADISFYANGVEVQPNGYVHVSITDNRLASAVDPMILHISDDGVVTSVDQDEDAQPAEGLKAAGAEIQSAAAVADASSGTLSFYTDSFSTYAVVQSSYTAGEEYVLVLYSGNRYYAITTSGGVVAATYADGRVTIDSLDNTTTLRYTYNAGGFGQSARFTAGTRTYYPRNSKLATSSNGNNVYLGVNNAGTALTTNNSNGNGWNLYVAAPGDIEATEVTMKFIDEAGTPVYVNINGTDVTEAKLADVLASGTLDMSTYKASAASGGDKVLTYSNAQYNEYHADASGITSNSGNVCYVIGEEIQKSGARNFQFERANGQTKTWTNFNAGDSVYLVFSAVTGGSGSGSGSGGEDAPDLGAVGNSKDLTDKEDGTYTLTLSVTGSAQSKEEETDINVLFVIDTSNSMGGTTTAGRTRLDDTKVAVNNMAEELLKNNTTSNSDAIELGLIDFNASSSGMHTFSDGKKWTTLLGNKTNNTTTGFAGEVNSLTRSQGTNWEEALADVLSATGDGDPTYVIFFTDGAPSEVKQTTTTHTLFATENCYWACRDEARAIVRNGFTLYTIFAYGSTTDSNNDYLGKVTDYAYNADVKAQYRFNATDTTGVENALKSILNTINLNFAYANVAIDDGVTGMSTTTLANAAVDSLTYSIQYRDYTSGTAYTDKTVTITENADGTISIPAVTYGVKDSNSTAGFKTITTKAVTVTGATYDTATGSVVWNIKKAGQTGDAAIYMLEDAWTYSVSFDLWPSQVSFDLVAALNNRLVTWGNDYTDPETGRVITFAEYKDQIGGASPGSYYLKTNTHATVSYQQYTAETDSEGNTTYTPVGEPKQVNIAYDDHMKLDSTNILLEKQWETGLSEAELAELVFGKDYETNPVYTGYKVVLKVFCDDQEYMTFTFPKLDPESGNPVDMDGNETTDIGALIWSDTLSIAPGILVQELPGGLNAADYKTLKVGGVDYYVLSHGHDYRIEEAEGSDLHFEYSSIVYHPMLKENKMINLDVETSIDSTTHQCTITGDTATIQDDNLTKFVGVNTLRGGVNIRKIVTTGTNKDEVVEDCTDVFAFEVTLKDKDGNPYSTPTDQYSFTEPSGEGWSKDTTDPDNPFWYRSGCSMYNVYDGEGKRIVRKPIPASGEFTVEMPADGEIRVVNLTAGTTYTITEITEGNAGYEFVKTLYEVKLGENNEGDIIEDGSSVFGESVSVNGKIRGNAAELVTYYNWAAYFFVYHSADNTVEKISFSDERVKGTYDEETGYSFAFNMAEETKTGSLYGGYYKAYSGAALTDAEIKGSTEYAADGTASGGAYREAAKDGMWIADGESAVPYTGKSGVWANGDAYTENGLAMSPKSSTVYYLKEVPETMYLQPYFHYTYYTDSLQIPDGWLISDVDDLNYNQTGFVIIDANNKATVVQSLTVKSTNGNTSIKLTPAKVFRSKGITADNGAYLSYLDVIRTKLLKNQDTVKQYWVTLDKVIVTSANARYYEGLAKKDTVKFVADETAVSEIAEFKE